MSGLTSQGFEPKPLDTIKTDLGSGFRAVFGAAITLIAQSIFGQIIGIFAERLADLWQLGLAIWNASTREGAIGIQLDNIGALTGTHRLPATYTHVQVTCAGVAATVITAGSIVSIPGIDSKFINDSPGTIGGGGTVVIDFRATTTGPLAAPSGTVTHIDSPISGWASCTNPLDENILGADIESDAAYRLRQVAELRALGSSTVAAIRAKLFDVLNVTDVFIFDNVGELTDANGLPPHTFECVVVGGLNADIASVISLNKPVGVGTYGTSSVAAVDGNGFPVTIKFSRPTVLNVYVTVNVLVEDAVAPSNVATLIKDAIVAYEINYHVGSEVRSSAFIPNIFAATPGILESSLPFIGTAASPVSSATLVVTNRQKADLDTSRTIVNVTRV